MLLCYRMFFVELKPEDVNPQVWVVMGAAAISTNAGSTLVMSNGGLPFLLSLRPFIDGVTLAMWAWAMWWIPLLVLLGVWKHGVARRPFALHDDALEHGIPARHVRGGQRSPVLGRGGPGVAIRLARHGLDRACRLDRNCH